MSTPRPAFSTWDEVAAAKAEHGHAAFAEEIGGVLSGVWSAVTGEALGVAPGESAIDPGRHWVASITVVGPWRAAIFIGCGDPVARQAAAAMFGVAPDEASAEEISDALGEVANMVGGHAKVLISSTSALGLPVVVTGSDYEMAVRGLRPIVQLSRVSRGGPVSLEVLGGPASPVAP